MTKNKTTDYFYLVARNRTISAIQEVTIVNITGQDQYVIAINTTPATYYDVEVFVSNAQNISSIGNSSIVTGTATYYHNFI